MLLLVLFLVIFSSSSISGNVASGLDAGDTLGIKRYLPSLHIQFIVQSVQLAAEFKHSVYIQQVDIQTTNELDL